MPQIDRPTSPHLQIYRWQITMTLSILHRMTGVALYVGTLPLVAFLYIVAYAPEHFDEFHECASSTPGQLLLMGWVFAFFYHFCNGIRHLFWDIGAGFTIPAATKSGWLVVITSIIATGAVWCYVNGHMTGGM